MNFPAAFAFIVTHASLLALLIYLSYRSYQMFSLLGNVDISFPQHIIDGTNLDKNRISKENTDFICSDRDVVKYIQRDQWQKAFNELLDQPNFEMNDKDLSFYQETFGVIQVKLTEMNKKNTSSLVYYRIPKSGTDAVRSFLYEYAFAATDESDKFILNHCSIEPCAHQHVELLPSKKLRNILRVPRASPNRYSFTVVREPISRFVAAIAEIEWNAHRSGMKTTIVSDKYPLGSIARFMEIVKTVVRSGGSNRLFRQFDELEMRLIAPMIGTIQSANSLERNKLHVFHYEELFDAFKSMGRDLGVKQLEQLAAHRQLQSSNPDPTNISHAATTFLTLAGRDAMHRYGHRHTYHDRQLLSLPQGQNISSLRPLAKLYIRSLCRVYLVDYVCGQYELPVDCQPLLQEVQAVLSELFQNIKCGDAFENCIEKQFHHE